MTSEHHKPWNRSLWSPTNESTVQHAWFQFDYIRINLLAPYTTRNVRYSEHAFQTLANYVLLTSRGDEQNTESRGTFLLSNVSMENGKSISKPSPYYFLFNRQTRECGIGLGYFSGGGKAGAAFNVAPFNKRKSISISESGSSIYILRTCIHMSTSVARSNDFRVATINETTLDE